MMRVRFRFGNRIDRIPMPAAQQRSRSVLAADFVIPLKQAWQTGHTSQSWIVRSDLRRSGLSTKHSASNADQALES